MSLIPIVSPFFHGLFFLPRWRVFPFGDLDEDVECFLAIDKLIHDPSQQ